MILSQPEIRKAVGLRRIVFEPPLQEEQWGEASVDLRLGFSFTSLIKIPGMKMSVADGLQGLAKAGFWRTMELREQNDLGKRESMSLSPGEFVLGFTHERVTVPKDLIARVEGRST
jgi:dCTP deaminase